VQFSPPGYSLALNNLAVTLHAQGKRQEAIHYYTRSLEGKVSQAPASFHCCLLFPTIISHLQEVGGSWASLI
jgi:hypothetical protein